MPRGERDVLKSRLHDYFLSLLLAPTELPLLCVGLLLLIPSGKKTP